MSRESGGSLVGPSPSLVPTRFEWRHDGHHVFLCGSFTSWQKMIPLSPMEHYPSVYQVVIPLAPDLYEYKFIVDGEWRHDEEQPCITDSEGNRKNFLIVKELEGVDHGNMEIEDGHVQLNGTDDNPVAIVDDSRLLIDNVLKSHTVYDILPDSGKVVALDVSLPIKQAFHVLYEQGIPSAPLWDSIQQQFVGMLTVSDFIDILMQIGSQRPMLSEEELESHTIAAWKNEKIRQRENNHLHYVGPDNTLKEVAQKLLHLHVATVPVLHFLSEEPKLPQLLHLTTLSDVLKCLCRYFRNSFGSLPLLNQSIGSLQLGTWRRNRLDGQLAIARANAPLGVVLTLLSQASVSSIPIVDENGSLLDIYARSDITALARDNTYAHMQLEHLTVEQALHLVHDARASVGAAPVSRCQMCLHTDSLQIVLERLAIPGVRRVICVEPGSRCIEGIITLSDVFRFLLLD